MFAGHKTRWKPGNLVLPVPAALVSCRRDGERSNLITVGWCGNINTNPPMLSVSIRPSRHSYNIIADTGEFVVNIPSRSLARAVDYCGVVSGRDVDKFAETGLTELEIGGATCPGVAEAPVSIPCRVTESRALGSHVLFLAEIKELVVDAGLIDKSGRFRVEKADLLCYAHGFYFGLGKRVGHFGWSVRKKPTVKKKGRRR